MEIAGTYFFFFSSRRRHTRYWRDWSSDVCSSDLRLRTALHADLLAVVPELPEEREPRIHVHDVPHIALRISDLRDGYGSLCICPASQIGRASCRERV